MVKAIVIDDEKRSVETLEGLLNRYCADIEVIARAYGCKEGVEKIQAHHPDVIFLDIQMPDGSGFKLLESLDKIDFEVIFTTAYDQFAIKAFKYSALDYLLKPIDPDELKEATTKLVQRKEKAKISRNIKVLLENMKNSDAEPRKIILSTSEGMHVVEVSHIIRCESDDYYTRFFFRDGKTLLISKTLKENEALLSGHNFLRPHRSHLVNTAYIKGLLKADGGIILMDDGSKIPVSRRKREKVIDVINKL